MPLNPFIQAASALYRSAVAAADVLAVPGTVTCSVQAGGSATAGTYNVKVVAGNGSGRTTPKTGGSTIVTATTNLTGRAAFAAVPNGTFYDIYFSTDADPKWVGRITEAQRAAGCVITAVGVIGAGGIPGAVDIQIPGTGGQSGTTAAENTAYAVPAGVSPVDCNGYQYVEFDITASLTQDVTPITMTVIPFAVNSRTGTLMQLAAPVALTFGGATGILQPLTQKLRFEVRGATSVHLLIAKLAGTGASINIDAMLS